MADLSKLSDSDLDALERNDIASLSAEGRAIVGGPQADAPQGPGGEPVFPVTPGVVRYAAPMAVGMGLAPFTGGMSALPAAATIATTSGVTGGLGSLIAQLMEKKSGDRPNLDPNEIAADTIVSSAPFATTGKFLTRGALNVLSSLVTSEFGRYIRMGDNYEFKDKDNLAASIRWGTEIAMPFGLSALGSKAASVKKAADRAAEIRKERFGGDIMLTDLREPDGSQMLKAAADIEAERIKVGSKKAVEGLANMDPNIRAKIVAEFQPVPGMEKMAEDLHKMVGALDGLREGVARSKTTADSLATASKEATGALLESAPAMKEKAREAAFEAVKTKAAYELSLSKSFPDGAPLLDSISKGRRIETLTDLTKQAKDATKSAVDSLYTAAGIGKNDSVLNKEVFLEHLAGQAGRGGNLEGNIARKKVRGYFLKAIGKKETMTLEGLQNLKKDIAAGLVDKGLDPKSANREAAGAYEAVSGAADDYMAKNFGSKFPLWKSAQAAAAANFKALDTDAINLIASGDANGLWKVIQSEGWGPVAKELDAYASIIKASGAAGNAESAANAAVASDAFRDGVNKLLRDTAIDHATNQTRKLGFSGDYAVVNHAELIGSLQELSTRKFDINQLGFGNKDDIATLARLNAPTSGGGYTVKELEKWLKDVAVVGGDAATARAEYSRAVVDTFMDPSRTRAAQTAKKLSDSAKAAKYTSAELSSVYDEAAKDPLLQLLNNPKIGTSKNPLENMRWAERLMGVGEDTANKFVNAMEQIGRGADLTNIRKALAVSVMQRFEPNAGDATSRLNLGAINELFYGQNEPQRQAYKTLKALLGDNEFNNLLKFASPIHDIVKTRSLLNSGDLSNPTAFDNAVRVKGKLTQGLGGDLMANIPVLSNIRSLYRVARYHEMHLLYLNPTWAPRFAATGYNLQKFASQPVNAVALKLAQDDDAAVNAAPR